MGCPSFLLSFTTTLPSSCFPYRLSSEAMSLTRAIWSSFPWLSDTTGSPNTRFFQNPGPYVRIDNQLLAVDYEDLTDGVLVAPINVTETGDAVLGPSGIRVWTGTSPSGNRQDGALCNEWSSSSMAYRGAQGRTDSSSSTWSYSGAATCNKERRLYCMEQ